jgi:hypothetical protein
MKKLTLCSEEKQILIEAVKMYIETDKPNKDTAEILLMALRIK